MRKPLVAPSPLDAARFGIVAGRAAVEKPAEVPRLLREAEAGAYDMVIVHCPVDRIGTVQALEAGGASLMDTVVRFSRDLRGPLPRPAGKARPRMAGPADAPGVRAVAEASFRGYIGHYHADPRLPRRACDEAYASWAERCCLEPGVADFIVVAEAGRRIAGFVAARVRPDGRGEIVLNAVAPAARRLGIYSAMLAMALRRFARDGVPEVVIATQLRNLAVQRAWVRLGLVPSEAHHVFHLWRAGTPSRR